MYFNTFTGYPRIMLGIMHSMLSPFLTPRRRKRRRMRRRTPFITHRRLFNTTS